MKPGDLVFMQYKALSEGFEWWDGSRWSGDKGLYIEATRDDHKA